MFFNMNKHCFVDMAHVWLCLTVRHVLHVEWQQETPDPTMEKDHPSRCVFFLFSTTKPSFQFLNTILKSSTYTKKGD